MKYFLTFIHRAIIKIFKLFVIPDAQIIYSQSGEDLIMYHLFNKLGISKPNYLDIGANEPRFISNTYRFYSFGSSGVLVEPNPILFRKLQKKRPRDIVLNIGIGLDDKKDADFYLFPESASGLSTFSKKDAYFWQEIGLKGVGKISFQEIIKIELVNINKILETYFHNQKSLDLISIDVEGLDLEILKSIDFDKFSPLVICVETIEYDEFQKEKKNLEICDYLRDSGYEMYADTRYNTIFCKKGLIS